MKTPFSAAVMAVLLAAAAPAHATLSSELIVNGSFESSVTLGNGNWTTVTTTTPASAWIPGAYGYEVRNGVAGTAKDGSYFVELDTRTNSSISQIVQTTLGQTYNLSFWYAPRAGVSEESNQISVLWNGGVIDTVSGNGFKSSGWTEMKYELTGMGSVGTLTFSAAGTPDSYGGSLDKVSMTAAVPEPETYAMLLAGLGLRATVARRRKGTPE